MFINGEFVDDALVRLEASQLKERVRIDSPNADALTVEIKARELAREIVIERILLRQAAQKDSTPVAEGAINAAIKQYHSQAPEQAGCLLPRDLETLRANIELDLRIERFLETITAQVPKPPAKQVAAFYQYAKESLMEPERVHAAHIVRNVDESTSESAALAAIRHVQSLLQQGAPFEQTADEYSDCPGRGGDLGFFERGHMVEEFDDAVFNLRPGEVSEIFRTPFGFHIAKVHERKAQRLPALNEIRLKLEASIWTQAKNDRVREVLDGLRAHAEVRRSK